ncbi:complex I NDUFA9 subunit family protein [Mesorhizobium tamadayense]|uniref:Complex I NDUFA9 subunit family protein n=1 Tax=Mesorhizobium tamadayense TaxID=425306 RepID=A0A3P3FET0_9HYPH|nr:complex I NDUFA9 subunit family protein [Mesorhizobium tamadayense]RRH97204.1 complex I NDUFA9 subunit family protein [Mesorhizobium tamadayense]
MASDAERNGSSTENVVTVFGGTGFLGQRIVSGLLDKKVDVRAVSRHPNRNQPHPSSHVKMPQRIEADILNRSSIAAAVAGSRAVVNAVSLYVERAGQSFERVHVEAAADLAAASREAGVEKFIQISGIGSDARSSSAYISARGRGEEAVKTAFPQAAIVRPAVMIGPGDSFLAAVIRLLRLLPVYPLFGSGDVRLQPVYVGDVAEAVARLVSRQSDTDANTFEFAGQRVYAYRDLVREIAGLLRMRTTLMPVPYSIWMLLATAAEWLPGAPLTRNQVELMQNDNILSGNLPGLKDLGIEPYGVDPVVRMIEEGH